MISSTLIFVSLLGVPNSPKDIVYPEYVFTVPSSEEYVSTLDNGVTVFIAKNSELPLIGITATFEGGGYLDSQDGVGLTPMMASLLRSGGTESLSAEEFDESLAYLATNCSAGSSSSTVVAQMNCLSSTFDDSFALFFEMLTSPRFQEDRVGLAKSNVIEGLKQRNDNASDILTREFSSQLFGETYLGRKPVLSSIESVDVEGLHTRHQQIISPENVTLSVVGDFEVNEMLTKLNDTFGSWAGAPSVAVPGEVASDYVPGIYYVQQDVPQGGVRIGIRSIKQGDGDAEAMEVMNYILGGGGFGSRITQSVRSREGLAYGAGSRLSTNPWTEGMWGAGFESKSSTVALATELVFDEIHRIKTEPVSEEELEQAKKSIIEQFPSTFQSKEDTLDVFVHDAITNRPAGYWESYRDKINSVSSEDVMRVANRLLRPKDMVVVVVGDWENIAKGDSDGRSNMQEISEIVGGTITELPLKDPLTLEVIQ